jgi:hypothetical protein
LTLFLDASVLLAATGSEEGASRIVFQRATTQGWNLRSSPYAIAEAERNLHKLGAGSTAAWPALRSQLEIVSDVFTVDRPVLLVRAKDRPILYTALAWAEVLLTLDRHDFGEVLGSALYGLQIFTPGAFLERERAAGRLSV